MTANYAFVWKPYDPFIYFSRVHPGRGTFLPKRATASLDVFCVCVHVWVSWNMLIDINSVRPESEGKSLSNHLPRLPKKQFVYFPMLMKFLG